MVCLRHAWMLSNTGGGGDSKGLEAVELNDIHRADVVPVLMLLVSGWSAGSLFWVVDWCVLKGAQHWVTEQGGRGRWVHNPLGGILKRCLLCLKEKVM